MKKLIAILLVFACMFAMASCAMGGTGGSQQPATNTETQKVLDALTDLIRKSAPTKSEVTTVTGNADINLTSTETVVMGELSGKEAALYVYEYEKLGELGEASAAKELVTERQEYVEGYGVRVNGGKWEDVNSFVIKIIPYRINLDASLIQSFTASEGNTAFTFVVPNKNLAQVLTGMDVSSITTDVAVTIETDGSAVTHIGFKYDMRSIALDANTQLDDAKVEIDAIYSYDLQSITLIDKK